MTLAKCVVVKPFVLAIRFADLWRLFQVVKIVSFTIPDTFILLYEMEICTFGLYEGTLFASLDT